MVSRSDRRPRLILADDHRLVIEALRVSLAEDFTISGVAYDGGELLKLLEKQDTDVILLDLDFPGKNGLELLPTIRRRRPDAKVIVLTMHVDRGLAEACIKAGAHGFVPKEADFIELTMAIQEVLEGRRYVSSRVPKSTHRLSLEADHIALQRLTPRQQEVLLAIGEGQTPVQISRTLHVSPSTVTFHRQNLMKILGFEDEGALVQYAVLVRTGASANR